MGACASKIGLGLSKSEAPTPIEAPSSSPKTECAEPAIFVPSDGGVAEVQKEALVVVEENDMNKCGHKEEAEAEDEEDPGMSEWHQDETKRRSLGILFQESDSSKKEDGNKVEAVEESKTEHVLRGSSQEVVVKTNKIVENEAMMKSVQDAQLIRFENKVAEATLVEEKCSSDSENKATEVVSVEEKHSSEAEKKVVDVVSEASSFTNKLVVEDDCREVEVKNPESAVPILEAKTETKVIDIDETDEFVEQKVTLVKPSGEDEIKVMEVEVSENEIQKEKPVDGILAKQQPISEKPSGEVMEVEASEIKIEGEKHIVELVKQEVISEKPLSKVMEVEASERPNDELVKPSGEDDGLIKVMEAEVSEKSIQAEKPSDELLKQEPSEEAEFKVMETSNDGSVQSESKPKNLSEVENNLKEESKSAIVQSEVPEANPAQENRQVPASETSISKEKEVFIKDVKIDETSMNVAGPETVEVPTSKEKRQW